MVLRGDFDPAGFQILHRLVAAAMAEFQLESFSAERLAENLVAEADAENRNAGVEQRLHFAHDIIQRGRIAGAVREKNSGGLVLERVGGAGGRGQNLRGKTVLPQAAEDVVFHPVIERDDRNVRRRHRLADIAGVGVLRCRAPDRTPRSARPFRPSGTPVCA